ncbi:MAG: ABC transporter ATP-binding protein/permease [Bacteroidia bacterium]|nr:ABC transporter ATP-binding protein/permease [Bacteroidia bacterium]
MTGIFHALRYVGNYKKYVFLNILSNIFYAIVSSSVFILVAPFLDLLFKYSADEVKSILSSPRPGFKFSTGYINESIKFYLAYFVCQGGKPLALIVMCVSVWTLTVLKNFFRYAAMYCIAPIRNGVVYDLRNSMYAHALRVRASVMNNEKKGDIISRMSNDVNEIEWSIMQTLEMIFREPIILVLISGMMFFISWKLTLYMLLLMPLALVSIRIISIFLKRKAVEARKMLADVMSRIEESLQNFKIIKAFSREEYFTEKFRQENQKFKNKSIQVYRLTDLGSPLNEVIVVTILMIILYSGGTMVFSGELDSALFITYFGLASQLIPPVKQLSQAYANIQKGIAAEKRIREILDLPLEHDPQENLPLAMHLKSEIRFENVYFTHQGRSEPALNNINLTIEKGKMTALVGKSGSGKTTLTECLLKLYEPQKGTIYWDGLDICKLNTSSLRNKIALVSQEVLLFNDTVLNNISFGSSEFLPSEIEWAARIAHAHDFIMKLPMTYQTLIGDRGNLLSGGQKQRLSLARAILRKPSLLILDEATSALDPESEKAIKDAMDEIRKETTLLVIAHRISTIRNADKIVMMEEGKITAVGTHEELIRNNKSYEEWCRLQGG